jgi:DNA-binding transcriptional MerR regulator
VEERSWSVGELAAAAGLSVRVLRHWDALGVVSPVRTASGHRRYGPAEVTRLYQALALRRTGLPLERIADLLSARDTAPEATLRSHLDRIERELARTQRLRDRLTEALAAIDSPPVPGEEDVLMKVIASMTMFDGYVHGHRPVEHTRLADQADTLTRLLHSDTGYPAGSRVLEVGCGVGAQTATLARLSPGAHITAVDVSAAALEQARRRLAATDHDATVSFEPVDVTTLPQAAGSLQEGSFDHVFVCFVLEHLTDPREVLTRLRRMVRPGGTLTVVEGDHGSAYFHPDSPAARDAIACQIALQQRAGGDALIGRRLRPLLAEAGYSEIAVSPRTVYVDADHPDLVEGFTRRTFTAMISGVREPAIAAGLTTAEHFDAGIADLLRTTAADGTFNYTFFKATATA